jgi:hypothetical protein
LPAAKTVIRHFETRITKSSAQDDLALLQSVIGADELKKKLSGLVLNSEHVHVRNVIVTLARLYRIAEEYNLQNSLLAELRQIESIVTTGPYGELVERYLALLIADKEFSDMSQALPEYKVLDDSNPDWTFRTKSGTEFYLEVSAMTIQKVIDDLQAFNGRIPTAQIIKSHSQPLYFEVIFPDNPRKYDPSAIGDSIVAAAKVKKLPAHFTQDGVRVLVDLLSARRQRPQLIRDELNGGNLLMSTCLLGERLAYTLATDASLKSIDSKISKKKRSNRLDKIGNVWLCIYLDSGLEGFSKDEAAIKQLRLRISRSKWLNGLIAAGRYQDADIWRLSYIMIE